MRISELIQGFKTALSTAFPAATVETAKTVTAAIERVASYSASRPLIIVAPGGRIPLETAGNLGRQGGVVRQTVQVWTAASNGIAKTAEKIDDLADLAEEVEDALLSAPGDWQDPRLEGADPAQLPDGYPLDAWLTRISVIKE